MPTTVLTIMNEIDRKFSLAKQEMLAVNDSSNICIHSYSFSGNPKTNNVNITSIKPVKFHKVVTYNFIIYEGILKILNRKEGSSVKNGSLNYNH